MKKLMKNSALTFIRNVTSLLFLLHFNEYKVGSLIRNRVTVSVLDVKMGHTLLGVLGIFLLNTLLYGHAEGADAVLEIPEFTLFEGDLVTLRCKNRTTSHSMKATFYKDGSPLQQRINPLYGAGEKTIYQVSVLDEGWYKCKADNRTESTESLLKVNAGRRRVTLTADRTIIPLGGNVTLTCSVEDPAGFKYEWYRKTSDFSGKTLSQAEIVNKTNRVISQGGKYTCSAWSSEPYVVTPDSNAVVLEETVSNRATLTLQHNRPQIFSGEMITLRCEIKDGGDTEWMYEWSPDNMTIPPTHNEYRIVSATEAHSGVYRCKGRRDSYSSTEWSDIITLTVSSNRPKAELRADDRDIPVGGSVTLTCSVNPSSSGWKYFWYRGEKTSEPLTSELSAGPIRVSEEGVYWCRGRGEPVYYTEYSDPIPIYNNVPNKAVVTLQSNVSETYRGEMITLRCEIEDGGDTVWEYEWKTQSSEKPSNKKELIFKTESDSGVYRCKGRKKSEKSSTDWSDPFKLTVSDKPQSVLSVSPSWLSAGNSVTLNCSVKDQSAGWRFYWYKTVPKLSDNSYSYELLPGSSSGTEQDYYIVHGQTHTAGFVCRAGRGDPVYYIYYSKPNFVWSADFPSSASLTVSPDRAQHFTSDSVSLSCEGNSTEWRVKRLLTKNRYLSGCISWGTMTGPTCKLKSNWLTDAVYWCESGSGEFSNIVNITVQDGDMILLSPTRPVTEGGSVSLSCKLRRQTFDSTVFFYHNEKLIQSDTRWELNISAVSKSDEGFYKCQHSGQESAQSWMSVQAVSRPDSSSFPVLLIAGLVCGIVLVISLLVLFCCRASKDSCFRSPIQSKNSNTYHVINLNEIQCSEYSSPPHDAGGSQEVTYSSIQLKSVGKKTTTCCMPKSSTTIKARRRKACEERGEEEEETG